MNTAPLDPTQHNRENFNCEEEALVIYLKTRANKEQKSKVCACFVTINEQGDIIGYYTLSNDKIPLEDVPEKFQKQLPRGYDGVPVTLLGRIARDISQKGTSLGGLLLMDALKRAYAVSAQVGSMAIVLDPKNPKVEEIYSQYGFIKLETGRMFLPMKTVAQLPGFQN